MGSDRPGWAARGLGGQQVGGSTGEADSGAVRGVGGQRGGLQ